MMHQTKGAEPDAPHRAPPWTLVAGLALIGMCSALLYVDVSRRGGLLVPDDVLRGDLPEPVGLLEYAARWAAVNMTAVCWLGYLLVFDGLLTWLARRRRQPGITALRSRPNRFVLIWLTSIPVWCLFDAVNFYMLDAWRYHGLPPLLAQRMLGYFLAFAAILPGMFLAAQLFQHLGFHRTLRLTDTSRATRMTWILLLAPAGAIVATTLALLALHVPGEMSEPMGLLASALLLAGPATVVALRVRCPRVTAFALGLSWVIWTLAVHEPIANMTLWVGLWLLLDPINARLRAPALINDWLEGRYGRSAALFSGGLLCGLLWELWNYWAIAKWTYHLPFLGPLETLRYFEMPLPGLLGFIPFAAQCWVMMNTIVLLLNRAGLRVAEPLPNDQTVM